MVFGQNCAKPDFPFSRKRKRNFSGRPCTNRLYAWGRTLKACLLVPAEKKKINLTKWKISLWARSLTYGQVILATTQPGLMFIAKWLLFGILSSPASFLRKHNHPSQYGHLRKTTCPLHSQQDWYYIFWYVLSGWLEKKSWTKNTQGVNHVSSFCLL